MLRLCARKRLHPVSEHLESKCLTDEFIFQSPIWRSIPPKLEPKEPKDGVFPVEMPILVDAFYCIDKRPNIHSSSTSPRPKM